MQVVDFRTIEIYIDTLAKKNATKMKLAKNKSVYAKVFKEYEKGNILNLREAFEPIRKAPSSLFAMAVFSGTVALVACGLSHSLGTG